MILVLKKREFYISLLFLELHFVFCVFFIPRGWELQEKDEIDASYVLPSATNAILNDGVIGPFKTILVFPLGCCVSAWNFSGSYWGCSAAENAQPLSQNSPQLYGGEYKFDSNIFKHIISTCICIYMYIFTHIYMCVYTSGKHRLEMQQDRKNKIFGLFSFPSVLSSTTLD